MGQALPPKSHNKLRTESLAPGGHLIELGLHQAQLPARLDGNWRGGAPRPPRHSPWRRERIRYPARQPGRTFDFPALQPAKRTIVPFFHEQENHGLLVRGGVPEGLMLSNMADPSAMSGNDAPLRLAS